MGECFAKSANGGVPFGPGGCQGQEACDAYCKEHPDECQNVQQGSQTGPGGCTNLEECQSIKGPAPQDQGPKQTGPGGCSSPEECASYCEAHREECGAPVGSPNPSEPNTPVYEQSPQIQQPLENQITPEPIVPSQPPVER